MANSSRNSSPSSLRHRERQDVLRIATWNLERGGRTRAAGLAQDDALRELAVEVVVLTEPPSSYRTGPGVVASAPLRRGAHGLESWVAIVGRSVEPVTLDVPFGRLAVAASVTIEGVPLVVYGAVLPWLTVGAHEPELARDGEDSFAVFERVLAEQAADVAELRRRHGDVVWLGDFNETLAGPSWGGSARRRALLEKTLSALGYAAWNAAADHAKPGMCAVDLICGPADWELAAQGRVEPSRGGVVMSDHAGYWVQLATRG